MTKEEYDIWISRAKEELNVKNPCDLGVSVRKCLRALIEEFEFRSQKFVPNKIIEHTGPSYFYIKLKGFHNYLAIDDDKSIIFIGDYTHFRVFKKFEKQDMEYWISFNKKELDKYWKDKYEIVSIYTVIETQDVL